MTDGSHAGTGGAGGAAADDARNALGPVVADLPAPRAPDPVSLLVVADPHLAVEGTGTWKVRHRTEERLRTAVGVANGAGAVPPADGVVFAGDLTYDGAPGEFDRFDDLLAGLRVPWTAVPGNHDVPKSFDDHGGPSVAAFRERYAGDADPRAYPSVFEVGGVRVVCLNTAAPPGVDTADTWGGAVGSAQAERLRGLLAAAPGAPTVAVAHHNLGALPEHEGAPWDRFPVDDAPAVRSALREGGVRLAVTGHHHVPAVRAHGGLTEVMAPAVCSFPQAALALRVGPEGTTVRLVPLADREGVVESYWHAATGADLGRGVLDIATDRLAALGGSGAP